MPFVHGLFPFSAVSSSWWRMDVQQSLETVSQAQRRTSIVCSNGTDRMILRCVYKRSWHCSLFQAFFQKYQQDSFYCNIMFLKRSEQRTKQIAILSISEMRSSLPANYREPFRRTELWPRLRQHCFIGNAGARLLISIVSASPWLWMITTSLCCSCCLENNIHE